MTIDQRISRLRNSFSKKDIDGYIITGADPHLCEEPPKRYRTREYISGFTGSAGSVLITKEKSLLWSDFRYWIQGRKEVEGSELTFIEEHGQQLSGLCNWVLSNFSSTRIGIDGNTISYEDYKRVESTLKKVSVELVDVGDLLDDVWDNRPELPCSAVYDYSIEYCGQESSKKLEIIRKFVTDKGNDSILFTSLDDICWILNIRSNDISYFPVAISYLYIDKEVSLLFLDSERLDQDLKERLQNQNVFIEPYSLAQEKIIEKTIGQKILVSESSTNYKLFSAVSRKSEIKVCDSPVSILKACKNEVEIDGFRKAMVQDGVAICKFLYWIKENVGNTEITELSASRKLRSFREEGPDFVDDSFETISAYKEHGAICHYAVTQESSKKLETESLLLIDSGGQYKCATTDITRTIALGTPTKQEKHDYTLVLKSHIALSVSIFPAGTFGYQLDAIARSPLWNSRVNFGHGTGHGVGHFLSVHEGPQRISPAPISTKMEIGMVCSNEPGLYIENKHGIRIENLIVVKEDTKNDFGEFFSFETLTYAPYNRALIDVELLTKDELEWLNHYNMALLSKIEKYLTVEIAQWLREECAPFDAKGR